MGKNSEDKLWILHKKRNKKNAGVRLESLFGEGFTTLLRTWAQLNNMESGSWFAICAICFNTSFLVMIPRSFLKDHQEKYVVSLGIFPCSPPTLLP